MLCAPRALAIFCRTPTVTDCWRVSWAAHQAGVPGAGALFAECADKVSLMTGRPQRFGTVILEHQGDMVMAPLDGVADDEMRHAFGLPSLAEMRNNVERRNKSGRKNVMKTKACHRDSGFVGFGPIPAPKNFVQV